MGFLGQYQRVQSQVDPRGFAKRISRAHRLVAIIEWPITMWWIAHDMLLPEWGVLFSLKIGIIAWVVLFIACLPVSIYLVGK